MFGVLVCLKDLIRFLRRDDATCEIRRQLGRAQTVEKVLICIQGTGTDFFCFNILIYPEAVPVLQHFWSAQPVLHFLCHYNLH